MEAVAVGTLVLVGLVYFAQKSLTKQLGVDGADLAKAIAAKQRQEDDIREVVRTFHLLLLQTGASISVATLLAAGITTLKTDADVRRALEQISATLNMENRDFLALNGSKVDLSALFNFARLEKDLSHDAGQAQSLIDRFRKEPTGSAPPAPPPVLPRDPAS